MIFSLNENDLHPNPNILSSLRFHQPLARSEINNANPNYNICLMIQGSRLLFPNFKSGRCLLSNNDGSHPKPYR